jgi:hypothetical protein
VRHWLTAEILVPKGRGLEKIEAGLLDPWSHPSVADHLARSSPWLEILLF